MSDPEPKKKSQIIKELREEIETLKRNEEAEESWHKKYDEARTELSTLRVEVSIWANYVARNYKDDKRLHAALLFLAEHAKDSPANAQKV